MTVLPIVPVPRTEKRNNRQLSGGDEILNIQEFYLFIVVNQNDSNINLVQLVTFFLFHKQLQIDCQPE